MIQTNAIFFRLRTTRWLILTWHRLVNGFEFIRDGLFARTKANHRSRPGSLAELDSSHTRRSHRMDEWPSSKTAWSSIGNLPMQNTKHGGSGELQRSSRADSTGYAFLEIPNK
jgi:hypothetical protein